ncbi:MAG: CPBP family intramembrane metalloprotease [Deltaproteobacteria bacterium]|nr:CPBP family intramembrane metalloprotease [Deltaproteobacteria bacterium]
MAFFPGLQVHLARAQEESPFARQRTTTEYYPGYAAMGSLLIPGLGQSLNEEYGWGLVHFGAYMALGNNYFMLVENPLYMDPRDRVDPNKPIIHMNRTTFEADMYGTALLDLEFYSSFAAYRDARQGMGNAGYNTPAPEESLGDLVISPFRWEFLSRPTTFIPLLFPLYLLSQPLDKEQHVIVPDVTITRDDMTKGYFVMHNMVAVGEEAFFRGVLNNSLSHSLGPGWGLAASSLLFGLAHEGVAGQATIAGAALFGGYLGALQQSNDYKIGEGVAIHFWWNFLISLSMLRERPGATVQLFTYEARF